MKFMGVDLANGPDHTATYTIHPLRPEWSPFEVRQILAKERLRRGVPYSQVHEIHGIERHIIEAEFEDL